MAQFNIPGYGMQSVIGGYQKDVEGEVLPYFSSYRQFAKEALLTRCTDGKKIISWTPDAVSENFKNDFCYFYFLAGHSTGTSKADRHFDFYINGEKYLTFITPQKKKPPFSWSFTGKDSVQLIFDASFTDIYDDAHGKLFLRVPKKLIVRGKSLIFSITGQNENSNDWFMIHRYQYIEKIVVEPTPLLIQNKDGIKLIVRVKADHTFNSEDTVYLKFNSRSYKSLLKPGYNYFELPVDTSAKVTDEKIIADVGNKFHSEYSVRFQPVHRREVEIIHHSHNDIGYSNLQEEVAKIQTKNIRNALKLIGQTRNYPEESRFKWNIESVWAVDNFLNEATEGEKKIFFDAVRKKQIGMSGHYANILTGLCKPEELNWITERAVQLRNEFQLPVNSVMLTDIPGVSWSEVQSLANHGFKYFSCGPNYQAHLPDKGERIGGTIRELGDKPFYWMSENGKSKILFWVTGRGYSMFHQVPDADLDEKRQDKIVDYMSELDSINYPYDIVQMRYAIKTDNGPTDSTLCDFVKTWNEKYLSPKLNITTVGEMMENFEKRYGNRLPAMSGDFTPYWEDGAYSTAREESETRVLAEKIIQLQKLFQLNPGKDVDTNWFYRARRCVVMFHEHTWGSWNSVSEPDIPFTTKQWDYKKQFLDSADYYLKQIESKLIPRKKNFKEMEVWNTLAWKRDGYVETNSPESSEPFSIVDDSGNIVPFQKLKNGNICFIARDIPAESKKVFRLTAFHPEPNVRRGFFPGFTFSIDSASGAIKSLQSGGKIGWVDTSIYKGINYALYVAGLNPENFAGTLLKKAEETENGIVQRTFISTCSLNGTNEVKYVITQFNGLNFLKLSVTIDKIAIREKESVHIAFPFDLKNVLTRIGISDTFITPEFGQLAAGNRDYYSVQRWMDVSDSSRGITLLSPQCALWEIENMIDERRINKGEKLWKKENKSSSTLFAYAMNNYWHTNYKADQSGIAQFDFYLMAHDKFSLTEAQHFGFEANQSLLVIER